MQFPGTAPQSALLPASNHKSRWQPIIIAACCACTGWLYKKANPNIAVLCLTIVHRRFPSQLDRSFGLPERLSSEHAQLGNPNPYNSFLSLATNGSQQKEVFNSLRAGTCEQIEIDCSPMPIAASNGVETNGMGGNAI
jgi:hypothetical protein